MGLRNSQGRVYAIEHHQQRFDCLQANIHKFGVGHNLYALNQSAPQALTDLPCPDKIFISESGGSLIEIIIAVWEALRPGGRLLASAVTEQTKSTLIQFGDKMGIHIAELLQVSISRVEKLAGHDLLRPNLSITLICWNKPHA